MFWIFRFSARITSNRRAMSVDAFSAQSFRWPASRARARPSLALARRRRLLPRLAFDSCLASRPVRRPGTGA